MGKGTSNALTRVIERLESRFLLAAVLYGPDVSFGEGGRAAAPSPGYIEFLPDGKIFTVGARQDPTYHEDELLITTATRINADGTLDTTFDRDGILDLGEDPRGLALTPTRFYIQTYGNAYRNVIYARTTSDGAYDNTFGGNGHVDVPTGVEPATEQDDISASFIKALPDGTLYLDVHHEAYDAPDYADHSLYRQIVKLKPSGAVDTSFGDDGFIVFDEESADAQFNIFWTSRGLIRTKEARINTSLVALELTRYQPDGVTLDTTFGTNGVKSLSDETFGFTEQDDGKLLFFTAFPSTGPGGFEVHLSRLNVDGSLDTAFGNNGVVVMRDPDWTGEARSAFAHVDDQGRIVVVAAGKLYRFSPSGDLDTFPFDGSQSGNFYNVTTDPQGRIYASYPGVTRYAVHDPVELGRNDVVYVTATAGDDEVTANAAGENVNVSLNDDITPFDADEVAGFTFYLQDGDNTATVSLDLPTTITAGGGHDVITLAGGDDSITSGGGADVITVGDGNDSLEIGGTDGEDERHTVTGGDGNKHIFVAVGSITLNLGVGDSKVETAYQDGHNEIIIAGGNNDITTGGDADVVTIGGNGANHLYLNGPGQQVINTGDGPDNFEIFTAANIHSGGGNDFFAVYIYNASDAVVIDAGDGDDRLEAALFDSNPIIAHGGNGNDYFWGAGGTQYFYGDAGNDTLRGHDGSDLLSGGGGNDRLWGENGNDRLYGGAGRDLLFGGRGNDRIDGGGSPDLLYGQLGDDALAGGGGNDRLNGGGGTDTLHGNAGDDWFIAKDDTTDDLAGDAGLDASINDASDERTGIESPNRTAPTGPQRPPIPLQPLGNPVDLIGDVRGDTAVAGDGSFIVVGVVNGATTRTIQAQRYAPDGSAVGDVITLDPTDVPIDAYPSITVRVAIDVNGDAVIVYAVPTNPSFSLFDLSFVRISRSGAVSPPVLVAEGEIGYPAVSIADDGSFFVGWAFNDANFDRTLQMRAYNADGSPAAAQFTAADSVEDGYQTNLTISARPDGKGVFFAFEEEREHSGFVRVGRTSKSQTLGTIRDINRGPMRDPLRTRSPAVATFPDGSFVLSYAISAGFEPSTQAYALRFDRDFRARGLPIELVPEAVGNAGAYVNDVRVDILPDGGFIALFRGSDGSAHVENVYARRFRKDGTSEAAALLIVASHDASQGPFQLTGFGVTGSANAVAVYEEGDFSSVGPYPHRFRRFAAT